jgi:hypothetical protein
MPTSSTFERLRILTAMNYAARCVHVAAEMGLADALGDSPMPVPALAHATGARADVLERVLRLLAAHDVFRLEDGTVSHTEMSRLLRSDHPSSLRAFVRMIGLSVNWRAVEQLEHSVLTGEAGMIRNLPDGVWSHYANHPDDARIFDASMASRASLMVPSICAAYDFNAFPVIADIGGGQGHLLNAVLENATSTTGILFDLPHVVEAGKASGAHPRVVCRGGDFFNDPLPEAAGYILMEILHDWADEPAERIVASVRRAAPRGAHLLVMEIVPRETDGPAWAKTLDIVMLAHFGGKQRSREAYAGLLERNGFELVREIDTSSGISIFDAVAR